MTYSSTDLLRVFISPARDPKKWYQVAVAQEDAQWAKEEGAEKGKIITRSTMASECHTDHRAGQRFKRLDAVVECTPASHGISNVAGLQTCQRGQITIYRSLKITLNLQKWWIFDHLRYSRLSLEDMSEELISAIVVTPQRPMVRSISRR